MQTKNVDDLLNKMTIEEKIGQMIHLAVLEDETGWPSEEMHKAIKKFKPGAVRIYNFFGKQNDSFLKTHYNNLLQKWSMENRLGIPLIISADCEFGTGDIVEHNINSYPFLMGRTAIDSVEMAEKISSAIAEEASSMGFNMLHQPVVDVNTNPKNPVIGVRAASDKVEDVIKYVKAQIKGQNNQNVITVAKHYPGHGDTNLDSHLDLPTVEYDEKTLRDIHLKPFETAIEEDVDGIMTSHIIVKCLDKEYPVTLSKKILTNLLRKEQGFKGFVISDAMTMKAIADNYGIKDAVVKAINAGVDLILASGSYEYQNEVYNGMIEGAKNGEISEERINEAVKRILKVKKKHNIFDYKENSGADVLDVVQNNYDLSLKSYKESYTLLGNNDILPINKNSKILLTGVKEVNSFSNHLVDYYKRIYAYQANGANQDNDWNINENETNDILEISDKVDVSIVLSYAYNYISDGQINLINNLAKKMPVLVVSLGIPYGYDKLSENVSVLATYMQNRWGTPSPIPKAAAEALVSIIKGDQKPLGVLPINK